MKQGVQDVKHGRQIGTVRPDVVSHAMKELLGAAHDGDHRERGFDDHAFVPGSFLTDFDVWRQAALVAKAEVKQGNGLLVKVGGQGIEIMVRMIQGQPIPLDHAALGVQQPPQPKANHPPPFIASFLAKLVGRAALPNGKQQLNRVAVAHRKQAWLGQQAVTPVLMNRQAALQAGALRQPTKQRLVVALQPAVERRKVSALEGKQNPDCHQFARIQLGLRVLDNHPFTLHLVIDMAKNVNDNVLGSQGYAPIWLQQPQLLRIS